MIKIKENYEHRHMHVFYEDDIAWGMELYFLLYVIFDRFSCKCLFKKKPNASSLETIGNRKNAGEKKMCQRRKSRRKN